MKKVLYYVFLVSQGAVLMFSVAHSIYCMVTDLVISFGFIGYPIMFVPFVKMYEGGSAWNILMFLLFISVSIYVYVKAFIELLCPYTRKLKYNAMNFLWFLLAHFCSLFLMFDETYMALHSNYTSAVMVVLLFMYLIVIILKVHEAYDIIRTNRKSCEEFLPEEAQLDAKSYDQIQRTANGMPIIALGCFLVSLYLIYIDSGVQLSAVFINLLYKGTTLILVSNFIICINQTFKLNKMSGQPLPSKFNLRKIVLKQLVTFVLFVLSFFLFRLKR